MQFVEFRVIYRSNYSEEEFYICHPDILTSKQAEDYFHSVKGFLPIHRIQKKGWVDCA
jgi:hypothetical protein